MVCSYCARHVIEAHMILDTIRQSLRGKTINRILMNQRLSDFTIDGEILDLGSGSVRSSYLSYLHVDTGSRITSVDISHDRRPDIIANLEHELPIESSSYDVILCVNLLEHIYHHQQLLRESFRIVRPGGVFLGYVPFLVKYHADPYDYFRYTQQGLRRLLEDTGFHEVKVDFIGRGPFTAAWSQIEFIAPKMLRWIVALMVFCLDVLLLKVKPVFGGTYALGYIFTAKK